MEIAVDVGGTFTDLICVHDGQLAVTKVPSTPRDQSVGVMTGVERLLRSVSRGPRDITRFVHGTTVAINTILERNGASVGVLMTKGFEDTLTIGRQTRSDLYDLFLDAETPEFLAPRRQRTGIDERIDFQGKVLVSLDEEGVAQAARRLKETYHVESIAVCYLFSFLNPSHELRTREIINRQFPDLRVVLSCEVDPIFREYERLLLTLFEAYIGPRVDRYLSRLEQQMAAAGIEADLQIIQSRGGITSAALARERPVNIIMSGPAAGVVAAISVGQSLGDSGRLGASTRNLISLDIGGTSTDVGLVYEGRPLVTNEAKLDQYPVRRTMIDVSSIGAGGGSIAWISAAGGLRVGPQSAGSDPGPACYGLGGQRPALTDASVVLGFLDPDYFAGGLVKLDGDAAHRAVEKIASPLGMDILNAALGIHRVVNANIADQIRVATIKRGYDTRDFCLVAGGGAGPVHGGVLAGELSIPWCVVPAMPGAFSAAGLLVAPVEHENSRTFVCRLQDGDAVASQIASVFEGLTKQGDLQMERDRISRSRVKVTRSCDMRYAGQSYELEVPLGGEISLQSLTKAVDDFHARHDLVYGHRKTGVDVEFVNFRTVHSCYFPPLASSNPHRGRSLGEARKGTRRVYFGEFVDVPVYERSWLPSSEETITGPAIIEQADSTTVLYPGQRCIVHPSGNLLVGGLCQKE
ncbi:MAG: hydantoinase/oxoprolinase family protein [Chloroflexi bacterium]|nr:hydantoinase/oxoprolinase family protein [Chloroflexota bacterium]